jgi:hypothetical protein
MDTGCKIELLRGFQTALISRFRLYFLKIIPITGYKVGPSNFRFPNSLRMSLGRIGSKSASKTIAEVVNKRTNHVVNSLVKRSSHHMRFSTAEAPTINTQQLKWTSSGHPTRSLFLGGGRSHLALP